MRALAALLLAALPAAAQQGLAPRGAPISADPVARCLADPADAMSCALARLEFAPSADGPAFESGFWDPEAGDEAPAVTGVPAAAGGGLPMVEAEILFDTGSDVIAAAEAPRLERLARAVADPGLGAMAFVIVGHTDAVGTEEANCALSRRRAEALRAALVGLGAPAARLTALGAGEHMPRVASGGPEPANRRVGFVQDGGARTAQIVRLARLCPD